MVPPSGGVSWAQVHRDRSLHPGMPAYPLATPPSRVVRMEEADEGLLAVKEAIHYFVSSSCTSGKKGTSGLLTSSPMLTAVRANMAVSSGSGAAVATTPEGGSPTAPSSSEDVSPSPDAAIDILSTDGAPNEMLGAPWDRPAKSPGNRTGWKALWRSALFSSTWLRSKNLISGCTCRLFIPVCTGSSSGMQNPLANFIAVFS